MSEETLPEHVARNRAQWDEWAADYVAAGERSWRSEPQWGIWGIPEAEVGLLAGLRPGMDAIELGCGTAYVSAWMARKGARPTGIDNSEQQLATARRLQQEHDLRFPLIHGNAEAVPLPAGSFDFAISEYGAAIWCDPYAWIPEAARLLRPGGMLRVFGNGTLLMLCVPDGPGAAGATLLRDYFGMHRFEWSDDNSVEFHLGYGDWIRLFRRSGFIVEDLVELRPPEDAVTRYEFVEREWARRWPSEEAWFVRKDG